MRRIVVALAATVSGLILLFTYPTSTGSALRPTSGTTPDPEATDTCAAPTPEPSNPAAPSSASAQRTTASGGGPTALPPKGPCTATGRAIRSHWGTVQVQITVLDGRITAARAVRYDHGQQITTWAIPKLNAQVLSAQSARIDAVSGATDTSAAYISSLQSAIDTARL